MILFVICVIVSVVALLMSFGEYGLEISDVVISVFLGLAMGILIYGGISMVIAVFLPTEKVTYNTKIYALQDNTSVQGSFFLGSGNIDGKVKYYYLMKDEEGVTLKTIDSNSTIIIESSDEPSIKVDKQKFKDGFWKEQIFLGNMELPLKTKIIIPKGSIKYGFNVDLK